MSYEPQVVESGKLKGNPWNPNVLDPASEAKLDASVLRLGFFKPIIARELDDGSLEILGGHHRWESAIRLLIPEVPIINLGKVDDKKAKEIGLADNGRWGHDDAGKLAEVLADLDLDEISEFLPYSENDLSSIIATSEIDLDDLNLDDDDDVDLSDDTKAPPTTTIMRFKVPVRDAEAISETITRVAVAQGFDGSNALTNAGDALIHLLLGERDDLS